MVRSWPDASLAFSPKWTYVLCNEGVDQGASVPEVIRTLLIHGCATWEEFPYFGDAGNPLNFREWPCQGEMWGSALTHKARDAGMIRNVDVDAQAFLDLKQMLANGYVLVCVTYIFDWMTGQVADDPSTRADDAHVGDAISSYDWDLEMLRYAGGPYAFDGSEQACPATFVFDLSDLIREHHVGVNDERKWWFSWMNYDAEIHSLTFVDAMGDRREIPVPVQAGIREVWLTEALHEGSANFAPLLQVGGPCVFEAGASACRIAASVLDDHLAPEAVDVGWVHVDGPGEAVFEDPLNLETAVDLPELGEYRLRMRAFDGEYLSEQDLFVHLSQPVQHLGRVNFARQPFGMIIDGDTGYFPTALTVEVVDLSDPLHPEHLGALPLEISMGVVSNGMGYFGGRSEGGIQVIDFHVPDEPTVLGSIPGPEPLHMALEGHGLFVARNGGLDIYDVSIPNQAVLLASVPHTYLGNLQIRGDHVFIKVTEPFFDGLCILDVGDLSSPFELGRFRTPDPITAMALVPDRCFVGQSGGGIRTLDILNPQAPMACGFTPPSSVPSPASLRPGTAPMKMKIHDHRLYMAMGGGGLRVLEFEDGCSDLREVAAVLDSEGVQDVAVMGDRVLLLCGGNSGFVYSDDPHLSILSILWP